jgi:hypothetical protein
MYTSSYLSVSPLLCPPIVWNVISVHSCRYTDARHVRAMTDFSVELSVWFGGAKMFEGGPKACPKASSTSQLDVALHDPEASPKVRLKEGAHELRSFKKLGNQQMQGRGPFLQKAVPHSVAHDEISAFKLNRSELQH